MNAYEHHQPLARWIVILIAAIVLFLIWSGFFVPPEPRSGIAFSALVVIAATWMCSSMRTRVDAKGVRWSLTWGWPGGHIPFSNIDRVEPTTLNLMEMGRAGIAWTPWHGWLWRVAGARAVEIFTTGGGRTTLATDDQQGLIDAIERFRRGAA